MCAPLDIVENLVSQTGSKTQILNLYSRGFIVEQFQFTLVFDFFTTAIMNEIMMKLVHDYYGQKMSVIFRYINHETMINSQKQLAT